MRARASRPSRPLRRVGQRGEHALDSYLSEVLGQPIRTVEHGPRAGDRPIRWAYGEADTQLGLVKIGSSARDRELVRHEAEVLRMLADRPLKVVVPPVVLHHGEWDGREVLLLSPPPTGSGKVPAGLLHAAIAEIAGLGRAPGGGSSSGLPLACPEPGRADGPAAGGPAVPYLGLDAERHPDGFAWHGDFVPANLAAGADGRLFVGNWERFGTGVPFGFDALHHFFHRALRRMGPAEAARACVAQAGITLEPFGLSSPQARRTAAHYLITLADRHRRDGHEPLGPPSAWLTPLIDQLEALP